MDGASNEEIEVARRQVASSEASVAFSQAEYDRAREMYAEAIRRSTVLHGPLDVTTLRLRQGLGPALMFRALEQVQ